MTDRFGPDVSARFQRVRHYASHYSPRHVDGYSINNGFFTPLSHWDPAAVNHYFQLLQAYGTFSFHSHPQTGLVRTSDTMQTHMHRQWITDSVMIGYWQRHADPQGWQRNMATQAAVMNSQSVLKVVEQVEADPGWYRHGDVTHGIFHLYLPGSLHVDKDGWVIPDSVQEDPHWSNRKRLESQAQLLYWLVLTWLATDQPWGFGPAYRTDNSYIPTAISRLTRYLLAVTTDPKTGQPDYHTPSASSWEEAPFPDGMTSDAGFMVLALQAVAQLHEPTWNLPESSRLHAHIAAGRQYIHQRVVEPLQRGDLPMQSQHRPMDMSLTLLAASPYRFYPDNPLEDARIRLSIVRQCLTTLAGPYGMRRFNEYQLSGVTLHDNYLNYAGNFPRECYAHLLGETLDDGDAYFAAGDDTSSPQALLSRQRTSRFEYSAQWGLGLSASLQALVHCQQSLAAFTPADEAIRCVKHTVDKVATDVFNRCMAAIPGPMDNGPPVLLRADGSPCPPYAAMEAYQVVPDEAGNPVWLPGAHTLPWHAAQLFDGLQSCLV